MNGLKPLIIILGPTASGKTGLALDLAKRFDGELVNADSRQIYKEMDIATNKTREADNLPIHLLDLVNPDEIFSLATYKALALQKIEAIQNRGKLPILVGGTGLYISSIVDNLDIPKAPPDEKLRAEFEKKKTEELEKEISEIFVCLPEA